MRLSTALAAMAATAAATTSNVDWSASKMRLSTALAAMAATAAATTINVDWSSTLRTLKTEPALQVVVNPLIMRDSPVHDPIFANLKALGANHVRFVPWLPYPRLGVAELEPPSGDLVCGLRSSNSTEFPVTLDCAGNGVISAVDVAIYGTYSGYCGSLKAGSCNSARALQVVQAACVGQQSCTITPSNDFFGGDPCPGTNKGLGVQVRCSVPGRNMTYYDFTQLDALMADFMAATGNAENDTAGHSTIINFSTPPQWLYAGPRVAYPDDPHEAFWSYEQGSTLVDPTAKALGDYYGRLLAWYTEGGFTDEYGVYHASGHHYNITIWEVLNEIESEHSLSPQAYVQQYDAIVTGIKAACPHGAASMQFMGLAAIAMDADYISYWLNASNHASPDISRDWFSWHHYASSSNRSDPASYEAFFDSVDQTTPLVAQALALRDAISPTTKMDMDELGVILPNDNSAQYTRNDPGFPPVYWNAAASYYAYLFAQWSLLGVDVLGESQFVGYPELADLNLAPQYPSVAMVDWNSGNGTARYWILKLLLDELAVGQGMMNTTVVPAPASVTNPFCGDIINLANLTLACTTPGAVIDAIQFASYGTPNGDGTCGDWSVGACNAANSTAIVESYCLGQSSCVVPATTPIFGDPCYGTVKHLVVQAHCSAGGGWQPTAPPVHGQAFLDTSTTPATRRVLVLNKQHVTNDITLPGATGGSFTFVDETTGFSPYQTVPITADTWTLQPFSAGIVTMP